MASQGYDLSIAGLTVRVTDDAGRVNPWLAVTCQPFYSLHKHPAVVVSIKRDAALRRGREEFTSVCLERPGSFRMEGFDFEAQREGFGAAIQVRAHPRAGLSGMLRWLTSLVVLEAGGLMLHAASFILQGKGFVCPGVSGAGKTTLSRLMVAAARVCNDETTAVRIHAEVPLLYATPFSGELGPVSGNVHAPLDWVLGLQHGSFNDLKPLSVGALTQVLAGCVYVPVRAEPWLSLYLQRCEQLAQACHRGLLSFAPRPQVVDFLTQVCCHETQAFT